MTTPPPELDGAKVLKYAILQDDVENTGDVLHRVNGQELVDVAALAICQFPTNDDLYIFYCDSNWTVLTDLCRETMAAALGQAEFEYRGISQHWKDTAQPGH